MSTGTAGGPGPGSAGTSPATAPSGRVPVLAVAFDPGGPRPAVLTVPAPGTLGSAAGQPASWTGLPPAAPVALLAWSGPPVRPATGPGAAQLLVPAETAVVAAELRRRGVAVGTLLSDGDALALAGVLRSVSAVLGRRPTVGLAVGGAAPPGWAGPAPADGTAAWEGLSAPLRRSLEGWARVTGERRVLLAAPRSFCAGVERAVEIVARALDRFGPPVYVRRQIVHNGHVVRELEQRGAVFVGELDEVPEGATVVLAAHGVAPEVRRQAGARRLTVVDATCPLVAKVHREARRFAAEGRRIVLVGHADHEEVEGTVGEAPGDIHVVADATAVAALPFPPGEPVAFLTQTTLAVDETAEVVGALRARFPDAVGPAADDICYATQNRQDAVRSVAARCDLVLVVGSANSSNAVRLVEVARRHGCRAELVEDAAALELSWLAGVRSVGVTAGASAPESVVQGVVAALAALGPVAVSEHRTTDEHVRFSLPPEVR